MRSILILLLPGLLVAALAQPLHAQFWKKKKYHTNAASGKITKPDATDYRDAFSRKSKKGPNIRVKNKPFFLFRIFKSKKKVMHEFNTSRKTRKAGRNKFFKPKYSSVKLKKKSKDSFKRNARKAKKDAQRGGGGGNGIFRGRKK